MNTKPLRSAHWVSEQGTALGDEGVLLIDMKLRIIATDQGARRILAVEGKNGGSSHDFHMLLPESLREPLNKVGSGDVPNVELPFQVGKVGYTCRVFLIQPWTGLELEPMLALRLYRAMSVTEAVELLAEHYRLTDREQRVLATIAAGLTSKEAADEMQISPNTVKSFLRSIMLKMSVTSRAAVVGKLLEYNATKPNVIQSPSKPAKTSHTTA
jgi:DNA-binding CsgD family transcriptional regulator